MSGRVETDALLKIVERIMVDYPPLGHRHQVVSQVVRSPLDIAGVYPLKTGAAGRTWCINHIVYGRNV